MAKKKKPKPSYDFTSSYRGPMMLLKDSENKRMVHLTYWPNSLLDAYRAGILTGEAEKLAQVLLAPRKQTLNHPWRITLPGSKRGEGWTS